MTFKVIRGQGQAEEMTSVPYRDYFFVSNRVGGGNLYHRVKFQPRWNDCEDIAFNDFLLI